MDCDRVSEHPLLPEGQDCEGEERHRRMEKDTLTKLSYNELMELYKAIREEIVRRDNYIAKAIKEKPYGTD